MSVGTSCSHVGDIFVEGERVPNLILQTCQTGMRTRQENDDLLWKTVLCLPSVGVFRSEFLHHNDWCDRH